MPRPLNNPQKREREREVAAELYAKIFPDTKLLVHSTKALFYLKVADHTYQIEVKEQETVAKR